MLNFFWKQVEQQFHRERYTFQQMVLEQFGIGRKGGGEGGVLKPTSHPTQKLTWIIDLNVNHATIYL